MDDFRVTRYDDDLKVVTDAAIAINGEDGTDGVGVLPGGLEGQILTKASSVDYDTLWKDPTAGVPVDGTAGQLLSKVSSDPYDTLWINPPDLSGYLPLTGGTTTGPVIMDHLHVNSYFMAHPDVTVMRDNTNYPTITAGNAQIHLVAGPPTTGNWAAQIHFKVKETGGGQRWLLGKQNDAESTGNAGSSFRLHAYDDTGASLGDVFKVTRATRLVNFLVSPTSVTPTAGDNTTKLATTAFVTAAITAGGGAYAPLVHTHTLAQITDAATKADLTYVNSQDALKADITYVDTQNALKANITYVDTQLALKSNLAGANTFGGHNTFNRVTVNGGPLTVDRTGAASAADVVIAADTLQSAYVNFYTGASPRWRIGKGSTAESGSGTSSVGSLFNLEAYDNVGASLGYVFQVTRGTRVLNFLVSPTSLTPSALDNSTKVATTAYVDLAVAAGGGGGGQPLDATLTALAALNSTAGLLEQTGTDAFTKREMGVAASTSIPTRNDADTRYAQLAAASTFTVTPSAPTVTYPDNTTKLATTAYVTTAVSTASTGLQPVDATLTALAALDATAGLLEQTGADTFTKRALGVGVTTSVPTRADGDVRWAQLAAANTFTAAQTISYASTTVPLTLICTDSGAATAPRFDLVRTSASPAANDIIGTVRFFGQNAAATQMQYSDIYTTIMDPTAGVESSRATFRNYVKGAITTSMIHLEGGGTYINNSLVSFYSSGSNSLTRIAYNLAHYRGSSATITGAIVFHAATISAAIMHRFRVLGWTYTSVNNGIDFCVSGYHAALGGVWDRLDLTHTGTLRPMVRWGEDASGMNVLILGDVTTVWPFPDIAITEALCSHTGMTSLGTQYMQGWTVSLETDLSAFVNVSAALVDKGAVGLDGAGGATLTGALTATNFVATLGATIGTNIIATAGYMMVNRVADAADADLFIQADAGFGTSISLRTGSIARWIFGKGATAETGSNAGSNFYMSSYADNGAFLGFVFTVARADRVWAFSVSPTAPTPTALDNSTKLATTAYVDALRSAANTWTATQTFAAISSTAITENGTLLTAKYAPIAHTHVTSDVTGLQAALDAKEGLGVVAGINTQTASYTLVLADAGKVVEVNNASANTLTIPPNSTVAFPLNTRIDVAQYGAGQTTITAGAGVTIRQREAKLKLTGQYAGASLYKRGTDEWVLFGDVSA